MLALLVQVIATRLRMKCEHNVYLTRQCRLTRIRARGSALSLWFRFRFEAAEAQQPLLRAEAPALAENLDVLSDDRRGLGLANSCRDPRSVTACDTE